MRLKKTVVINKKSISESALKKSVSSRGPGRCFSLVRFAKPWDQKLLVQEVIQDQFESKTHEIVRTRLRAS